MVYLLKASHPLRPPTTSPERRRAVIVGASPAGISAAYHLGAHSLLLDQRDTLENSHARTHTFPMGTSSRSALGPEAAGPDRQQQGVRPAERRALFISCSSTADAGEDRALIHIERWRPPELTPGNAGRDDFASPPSALALVPLLRGEMRLGARLVRITPSLHMIELADGRRIVYDKLICTLSLAAVARMVMHELPDRVRCDEILRYWLGENDVELADAATQEYYGDPDDLSAGRRVALQVENALAAKFRSARGKDARNVRLFEPRIVRAAPAMP